MLILFCLIVVRMTGAFAMNSLWARANVPVMVRGMFIFLLSALLYVHSGNYQYNIPVSLLDFSVMMLRELFLGFVISFSMEISFFTVRYAGAIADFTLGLSMAQIYDPANGSQATLNSSLFYIFGGLVFFISGCHLKFFELLFETARLIPFGEAQVIENIVPYIEEAFFDAFVMGLEISFPIIAIELLCETALGILMRTIPQLNVFSVNFQVKLIAGLLMLLFIFNPLMDGIRNQVEEIIPRIQGIIEMFAVS